MVATSGNAPGSGSHGPCLVAGDSATPTTRDWRCAAPWRRRWKGHEFNTTTKRPRRVPNGWRSHSPARTTTTAKQAKFGLSLAVWGRRRVCRLCCKLFRSAIYKYLSARRDTGSMILILATGKDNSRTTRSSKDSLPGSQSAIPQVHWIVVWSRRGDQGYLSPRWNRGTV